MTSAAIAVLQFQPRTLTRLFGDLAHWLAPRTTRAQMSAKSERKINRADMRHALALVKNVCAIAGEPSMIEDVRIEFETNGLLEAVQRHDDEKIYEWLAEIISYQGVADAVADKYLAEHGCIRHGDVRQALAAEQKLCPKLKSYWNFENCGFRKTAQSCSRPDLFAKCPLPKHDLRNGNLNQAAYSLYLFMRDVAGEDFVRWIDRQLEAADQPTAPNRARLLCEALLNPLRGVFGVSNKTLSLGLSLLLMVADPNRERWVSAGAAMIVVDTLVHNWLHRTGILRSLNANHAYGPRCYGTNGCASIIDQLARQIDARAFCESFPKFFPRYLTKAVFRFCAQAALARCNGNKIDDRARCDDDGCPLYARCERVALDPNRI